MSLLITFLIIYVLALLRMGLVNYRFKRINMDIRWCLDHDQYDPRIFEYVDIFVNRGLLGNSMNLSLWTKEQFAPEFYLLINNLKNIPLGNQR